MRNRNYRRAMTLIASFLCISLGISAQQFSMKYGKVTDQEVAMTSYLPDTTANAVVIFKKGTTHYEFINNDFRVNSLIEVKIKILKSEGTEYADVSIPYYANERSPLTKEVISGLEATAYNMENGQIEKTKLSKEYIFKERVNDSYMQMKFSIPKVKAGTVIEYKYRVLSDLYWEIDNWMMQQDIPVVYNTYSISTPEYFKFNFEMRGGSFIKMEEKSETMTLVFGGGGSMQCSANSRVFSANNLPAIKAESYLWCPDDYKAKINFELSAVEIPGSYYRSFNSTWEIIDEQLLKDDSFGKFLKMKNPLQDEMNVLPLSNMPADAKIALLFNLLKQKISWNGKYALYGTDIKKSIKGGTASNAELNFMLISMLRDAGIPAYPVIMSRRDIGVIPYTHPSISKINTFVVGIQNSDSTRVYLDGSVENGFINILPPVLLVNRARILKEGGGDKWVNLSGLGNNQIRSLTNATINESGEIEGTRTVSLQGQYAAEARSRFRAYKDSTEYIEARESNAEIKIQSYEQEYMKGFWPEVKETFTFTKPVTISGEFIYVNPLIFTHIDTNPFIQAERKLPVEMHYPYSVRVSNAITIPQGYQVEELPKSQVINLENKDGSCRYMIQQKENILTVTYLFYINKMLFVPDEYEVLKNFWSIASDKNKEMIVLKKSAQ